MKKILSNRFKSALIKFSHTKIGRGSWKIFSGAVNSYYPKRLLIKALNLAPQHDYSDVTIFPKINKSLSDKNALVVMPFYGNDAVGKNIDTKIATLKSLGFTVHVLVFNNSPWDSVNPEWDFVYNVKNKSNTFGKLKYDVNNQVVSDGNKVDDWVDDEICQFVSALSAMNKFDLAIVNYVFLSKLCEYINPEAITIIDTHDVFAKRNTRMMQIGIKQDKFYFSTSKDEESKGLSRADYIFAIQEAEGRYFQESVNATVIVQPPILEANFINYRPVKDKKIIVGFMASGHYPNVVAINNFIDSLVKYNPHIRLDIAGTICGSLVDGKHPKFVNILGFCDSLEGFYSSCDIIINPDELLSGMKVKCLEALSFGVPLVSTQAAMEGIESDADYHHLESAEKCAEFIASIKKDDLQDMANKSRELFIKFNERYCLETTLQQVMKENEK